MSRDFETIADDELIHFESRGAPPLPMGGEVDVIEHDGARIWFIAYGCGPTVILLHGGLGHSGNWGHQVPALIQSGRRVVLIDSRGHGRSTRDARPYHYTLMSADVLAVMDAINIRQAALIGWSDGACTALILGRTASRRVTGVIYFGCNMDPSGTKPFVMTPTVQRCLNRHKADYAALSATPDAFEDFAEAVGSMQQTQPNYSTDMLGEVRVPVAIMQAENDEFIQPAHAAYLAQAIPQARLVVLPGVSHFAPLQRPGRFNRTIVDLLDSLAAESERG